MQKSLIATKIVHWPTGPVSACDYHAEYFKQLGGFIGTHVHIQDIQAGQNTECSNCRNEIKKAV